MAATGIEAAFRMLEGRWKMVIIFHLFDARRPAVLGAGAGNPGRLAEDADPAAARARARRHRRRTVYPQVPPKVEYRLTEWGQAMCPALDALLEWAAARPSVAGVE